MQPKEECAMPFGESKIAGLTFKEISPIPSIFVIDDIIPKSLFPMVSTRFIRAKKTTSV